MSSLQSLRQASVRAATGTTGTYEEDWLSLFDQRGIAAGTFNERMLAWINNQLSTAYASLPDAMQAFAQNQGYLNWSSMGQLVLGFFDFTLSSLPSPFTSSIASGSIVTKSDDSPAWEQENLALQGEALDITWNKARTTVNADIAAAYDGRLIADELVEDTTATSTHEISQSFTLAAGVRTAFSIDAKRASGTRDVQVTAGASGNRYRALLDLSEGSVASTSTAGDGSAVSASVEALANDWGRPTVGGIHSSTTDNVTIGLALHNGSTTSYTGDGVSGLFLARAHFRRLPTANDSYLSTTTAARFGHSPTHIAGENVGRYINAANVTNKLTTPNIDATGLTNITKTGDAAATLTAVDDAAELASAGLQIVGSGIVYKLDNSAGSSDAYARFSATTGNTNDHYASGWSRSSGGSGSQWQSAGTGASGNSPLKNNSGYERESFAFTSGAASNFLRVRATAGNVVYFILQQLEENTFASPPIVVGSSTATVAGRAFGASGAATINQILGAQPFDGTISMTLRVLDIATGSSQNLIDITDGTSSNRIRVFAEGNGDIRAIVNTGGITQFDDQVTVGTHGVGDNEEFTVTLQLAEDAGKLAVNGNQTALDTSVSLPGANVLDDLVVAETYSGGESAAIYLKSITVERGARL